MSEVINLQALLRRLDEHAYDQLCAEVARLAEENEHLRTELTRMEECAEGWCNEAQRLHQQLAGPPVARPLSPNPAHWSSFRWSAAHEC
ncbi:hypothetical protein [Pseudomonas aeruginosa]|uniref:hypothetical protein n=1 Tax=Pseudomonas aeruginosa TaxID=287 RepID=UPI000D5454D1|nr:hypothetical protein [Pseudomonas aeruginosa]AWF64021.1 hypothetical protein CSC27_0012 [Pseudomonas aeruginosa]